MTDNYSTIKVYSLGEVSYLELNRPAALNAITQEMISECDRAITELNNDSQTRVIVVKGAGRSFCSGYDLKDPDGLSSSLGLRIDEDLDWIEWQVAVFERLWRCPKPTIAQVHGHCYAGGGTVAGFCDLIVAADDAMFGQPQRMGFPAELCLWPITIGPRRTKELLFTARSVSGSEAAKLGMINHSVPASELDQTVLDIATQIALTDAQMLKLQKRVVNEVMDAIGLRAAIKIGAHMDLVGHRSEAIRRFVAARDDHGLDAALQLRRSEADDV